MTSKEAVLELICEAKSLNRDDGRVCFLRNIIEKDLEILECFRKIPKQDLKDFIEWQIRYEKNFNIWLKEFANGPKPIEYEENLNDLLEEDDLEKEEPIKYLIKIKEWLENE